MDKCTKELYNGDTSISERICLVIDDNVLVLEQCTTYNFLGGRVKKKYYNKRVGVNSLSELKEELGITINKKKRKMRVLSWHLDKNGCMRLLVFCRVNKEDLNFGKSTFRWETINFTLISLDGNLEKTNMLGKYLEDKIKSTNQPCVTHIRITKDKKIVIANGTSDKYITKEGDEYVVKLANNPILSADEKKMLRQINKDILGFDDEKYQFTDDYICRYYYIANDKTKIRFTISRQFFDNHMMGIYKVRITYAKLLEYLYKIRHTNDKPNEKYLIVSDSDYLNKLRTIRTHL